ncbi:hypothetical protein [Gemmobacter aquaticus]|uniref:hypothetical protein n=1 Tax=Gemmobacter aquaticus TaxID=490185 RepID=UPI001666B413|nr:hypothetical protein [Gemmobacter aquaticus]
MDENECGHPSCPRGNEALHRLRHEEAGTAARGALYLALILIVLPVGLITAEALPAHWFAGIAAKLSAEQALRRLALPEIGGKEEASAIGMYVRRKMPRTELTAGKLTFSAPRMMAGARLGFAGDVCQIRCEPGAVMCRQMKSHVPVFGLGTSDLAHPDVEAGQFAMCQPFAEALHKGVDPPRHGERAQPVHIICTEQARPAQGEQCVQRMIATGRGGGGGNEPPLGADRKCCRCLAGFASLLIRR